MLSQLYYSARKTQLASDLHIAHLQRSATFCRLGHQKGSKSSQIQCKDYLKTIIKVIKNC